MSKNIKLHTIAIASICAVITLVYLLFTPTKTADAPVEDGRAINIYSATWGDNCNGEIADANSKRQAAPLTKSDIAAESKMLTPVQPNNVLVPVSTACNSLSSCTIAVNSAVLGVEPFEKCYKQLTVTYRCFSYDRLATAQANQGKLLTIDCHETAPTHSK
jgi:hypothetical protein